jgi:membrane protease subunit HflC
MKLKQVLLGLVVVGVVLVLFGFYDCAYVVEEGQQAFLTQMGSPVGPERTQAGCYWKLPFIQSANLVSTKDKRMIYVAPFARWRIVHPIQFFQKFRDERNALSRLDDILDGATKTTVANHDLADIVRSNQRTTEEDTNNVSAIATQEGSRLVDFTYGREKIEKEVFSLAAPTLKDWGCELLDVRLQRVKYEPANLSKITARMAAERISVAEKYRSEGLGEANRISGEKEKEQKRLISEANLTSLEIRGKADADAAKIYADAYNQSKDAPEFYQFMTLLDLYPKLLTSNDTLILTTDSDLLRYLKQSQPAAAAAGH